MAVKFEIESVFKITEKGFWLPENSKLGNIEITNSLTQPRAIDENGNVRLDLWAFQLKNDSDSEKFKEGEIVELFPGDEIKFLPPWMKIESKGNLEDELRKEISNEHLLFGKVVEAIAKREDNDDVLFKIGEQEMAVVHLTWKGRKESSSEFPKTKTFNHWTEVYERVIVTDNKEYEI